MIRAAGIATLAVSLFSAPVVAQDNDSLRGVWQGTVGASAVHACFGGSDNRGVYYFDSSKQLIRLLPIEGEDGGFVEAVGWEDPGDASWQISAAGESTATGTWRDADTSAPMRLERLEWSGADEYTGPCESGAFMQPRLVGGSVFGIAGEIEGQEYITLTFVPPAHWQGDEGEPSRDVNISTFVLPIDTSGGHRTNRAINGFLTAHMPRGDMTDDFAQCLAGNIAAFGQDGSYFKELVPELITSRWVGVLEATGVYCGGAHPSHWQSRRVFDRNSGKEIETESWLNDSAVERTLNEAGADSYVYVTFTEGFVSAVVSHWQADEEGGDDCAALARQSSRWDIGLQREGLALIPSMPHVYTACAETVVLPWVDAAPFLSLQGQAVRLSLESTAQ